ncbi:hypothetical protein HNO89_003602 [Sporosarcina luteola]|nr:hypothetical protein [Sporosarcina luteola]
MADQIGKPWFHLVSLVSNEITPALLVYPYFIHLVIFLLCCSNKGQ